MTDLAAAQMAKEELDWQVGRPLLIGGGIIDRDTLESSGLTTRAHAAAQDLGNLVNRLWELTARVSRNDAPPTSPSPPGPPAHIVSSFGNIEELLAQARNAISIIEEAV